MATKKIYELQVKYKQVGIVSDVTSAVTSPSGIANYMEGAFDSHLEQESFWVILFNAANKPIARMMCTLGIANQTQIHPREAFRFAIREGGVSVAFAHNHPTGNLSPSPEDIQMTEKLIDVGDIIGIKVLDHLKPLLMLWNPSVSTSPFLPVMMIFL